MIRSCFLLFLFACLNFNPTNADPFPNPYEFLTIQDNFTEIERNISKKCLKDLEKWKISFLELVTEVVKCRYGNDPGACEIFKKQIFADNSYALYQIDSFGRFPPDLLGLNKIWMGDYDECLDVVHPTDNEYRTQFCWAHLSLPITTLMGTDENADRVKNVKSTCGAGKITDVKTSICMPRSCNTDDIFNFVNALLWIHTNHTSVCEVTCRDTLFWFVTVILLTIIATCITATLADYYEEKANDGEKSEHLKHGSLRYFLAFSLLSNGRQLMRSSRNPNTLRGVECIRFISFTWVVSGHIWTHWEYSDNPLDVMHTLKVREYELWINAFYSVDSFFFLSGLMLSYSFLPKLTIRKAFSPFTWIIFFLHRYLRLTPAYFFFLLFYTTYGPIVDYGPNELARIEDMHNCRIYGWKNLLYVNNIIEPRKACMSISWYLASDTQMYFASPIFLIAFLIGPFVGILAVIVAIGISTAIVYYLFYIYDLPASLIQAYMSPDIVAIHRIQDLVYAAAYVRIPPFLFGIVMGYALWKTRGTRVTINPALNALLWCVSACMAVSAIFVIFPYQKGDYWTVWERASYYAFGRIAWSLALCWLIFAINRGHGGLVTKFMSLKFWTPLGKLSFCAYLCHMMIVAAIFGMDRNSVHFVNAIHTYISKIVPVVFGSMTFALIWSLLFEMPFARLEGFLLASLTRPRNVREEKTECTKF